VVLHGPYIMTEGCSDTQAILWVGYHKPAHPGFPTHLRHDTFLVCEAGLSCCSLQVLTPSHPGDPLDLSSPDRPNQIPDRPGPYMGEHHISLFVSGLWFSDGLFFQADIIPFRFEPLRVCTEDPKLLNPHPGEKHPIKDMLVGWVHGRPELVVFIRIEDLSSLLDHIGHSILLL